MTKKNTFTSVITGDIVQSRLSDNTTWLSRLKNVLSKEGKSPHTWQVYRGDSFQVEVKDPSKVLMTAIGIKAAIKSIKDLDVRMSIGIGEKSFTSEQVAESGGSAFIFSGETFETLKKSRRNLAIKTPWPEFDREMNVYFRLASIPMDGWTSGSAELIDLMINHPTFTQENLARQLGITQPAVSDRQNRSHYDVILEFEKIFSEKIRELIHTI